MIRSLGIFLPQTRRFARLWHRLEQYNVYHTAVIGTYYGCHPRNKCLGNFDIVVCNYLHSLTYRHLGRQWLDFASVAKFHQAGIPRIHIFRETFVLKLSGAQWSLSRYCVCPAHIGMITSPCQGVHRRLINNSSVCVSITA
jgi:hypothetical protein